MTRTISNGCIPKGIKDQSKFKLSFPNPQIQSTCQNLYYFAASRATDVIRTHISQTVQKLRQTVYKCDATLLQICSTTEYCNIIDGVRTIINTDKTKHQESHARKLDRDINEGTYYIPWQQYANYRQRRSRRLKVKPKPSRIPSRRAKRKAIRQQGTTHQPNRTVPPPAINLSSKVLTEGHFGIFKKGPKFVPTPVKANFAEFQEDYSLWKNTMRWAYYHNNKPAVEVEDPTNAVLVEEEEHQPKWAKAEDALINKTAKRSKYMASTSKNPALELFFLKIDEDLKNCKEKKSLGYNLTAEERTALKEMKQWKDVIIRPYDKGIGFVVDDVKGYKERVLKEITNPTTYTVVQNPENAISEIHQRIKDWMERHPEEFSLKLKEWMIDPSSDFGYFYMNYKAHKPEKNYPGRLITSGCGSPTERLSEWIEFYLKPMMDELPYRLQDTCHFLRVLKMFNSHRSEEDTPPPVIHATWDITAMFPNISNELGLKACRLLLDTRQNLFPSTDCLVEAIQLTLEENIAKFDTTIVKQRNGTAMGPHHSCSYADITIDLAIDQNVMSYELNPLRSKLGLWMRFRDDIYCPWIGTEEELLQFDQWLNRLDPLLAFTLEYSKEEVTFLDLKVSSSGKVVKTSHQHNQQEFIIICLTSQAKVRQHYYHT